MITVRTVEGVPLATSTQVLDVWFGDHARARWFHADVAFDEALRTQFGGTVAAAIAGGLSEWSDTADGALALVIVLDQLTRNLFRGAATAFAGDARARAIADRAIAAGLDVTQSLERRAFFYLPFQHSEQLADQERSLALYAPWVAAHEGDARVAAEDEMTYVVRHHEIIRRFGRFPHRNGALGRISTPAEIAFLAEPGSSF